MISVSPSAKQNLGEMVQPLLDWYRENARSLPWRENTDPYRIWISEIMLQQTRVEAVKPYYQRFLARLPNIFALAEIHEDELFKLWEGLGYYSRARNLQKAARMICERFGGCFPQHYEDILSMPGVGPYTAGAIASIAFGQPTPAVDGNVMRVLARVTETRQGIADPQLKKEFTERLREIYPPHHCGDFTQSLMELGAIICLPNGAPLCAACPLCGLCRAFAHSVQNELPVLPRAKQRKKQNITVFLLTCGENVAVHKRESKGLLAGLWEFPNCEEKLTEAKAMQWLSNRGLAPEKLISAPEKKHIFTHVEWTMCCFLAECQKPGGDFKWVSRDALISELSLPTAFRQFLPVLFRSPAHNDKE